MPSLPTFSDARERSIWVQARLRVIGSSFAEIARRHGWSRRAVAQAMQAPSDPQEAAIAAALGVRQKDLFPERYGDDGGRLHLIRKHKPRAKPRNVEHRSQR